MLCAIDPLVECVVERKEAVLVDHPLGGTDGAEGKTFTRFGAMLESQFIDVALEAHRVAPENAAGACGRYVERLCVDPTLDGICFERRLSIQSEIGRASCRDRG